MLNGSVRLVSENGSLVPIWKCNDALRLRGHDEGTVSNTATKGEKLRAEGITMPTSGLRGIHDIPLGSHLCTFYRQPKEFLRMSASFLKAGLINHEICIWILPSPVTLQSAVHELSQHGVDSAALQATKQLQILSAHDYYFSTSIFDVDAALNRLVSLFVMARQLGYRSVRGVSGPGPFLSEGRRRAFMRYEQQVTEVIARHAGIGLCCYLSPQCLSATEMFDIMSTHSKALLRTHDGWATV